MAVIVGFDQIPKHTYQIIYADPPWEVERHGFIKEHYSRPGQYERLRNNSRTLYPMMSVDEIKNLPVRDLSSENCVLYLWIINKYLEHGWDIARSWGFQPSKLLCWVKKPSGIMMGGTYASNIEYILYCKKGKIGFVKRKDSAWFLQPRICNHSEKPAEFRDMIVDVHGNLPRIELFARQKTPNWDIWGNELENCFDYGKKEAPCSQNLTNMPTTDLDTKASV